jgi:flavin reductase (DIM6/NTAB) family NADH-FMN oxidoreductase RutF
VKPRHDMLAHGVNIVCAVYGGQRAGLSVAWATQVAVDHVLICVGAQSATRELILASQAFGLSVLAHDQVELARTFGRQSSRAVDKLEHVAYHTAQTGSPLLDDCVIALDCRIVRVYEFRSEKLIVGQIVAAEGCREDEKPLVYRQDDY